MNSYKGQSALLLGNGINRVSGSVMSWMQLLEKLKSRFDIDVDLSNSLKPFPLSFEEMLSNKGGLVSSDVKLENLKKNIATELLKDSKSLIKLDLFLDILGLGINEILTTNYDYNLENTQIHDFEIMKSALSLNNRESKHSLYRGYNINEKKVRHIHGELKHNRKIKSSKNYKSESIMIGFEHYASYLHTIQDNVKGISGKKSPENNGVFYRIKNELAGNSWCDLFFTHNLHILGLSLDFSENHLWWILLYRIQEKRKGSGKFNVKIDNKIYFYFPIIDQKNIPANNLSNENFERLYSQRLYEDKNKAVAELLKSLDVELVSISSENYDIFYEQALQKIRTSSY